MNMEEGMNYCLSYILTPLHLDFNQRESFMHKIKRKKTIVFYCCLLMCCILGSLLAVAFGAGLTPLKRENKRATSLH